MSDSTPDETTAGRWLTGRTVAGALLVVAGVIWLLATIGVAIAWQPALAGLLIVVGMATLAIARRGLHAGLVTIGVVLTVVLTLLALAPGPFTGGVGELDLSPTSIDEVDASYQRAAGQITLDLRQVELPGGETTVDISVGAGEITVIVPAEVTVQVDASVGMGEIDVFGETRSGVAPDLRTTSEATANKRLMLDLSAGLGRIEVRR